MNYEPLDSLPYIDEGITDEERAQVQLLINEELSTQDLSQVHPKVDELYPLPEKSRIIADIADETLTDENFTLGGFDLSIYSNIEDQEALKKSIAYTYLKQNALKVYSNYGKDQWLLGNDLSEVSNERIKESIEYKRRKIDIINNDRKLAQLEAEPVLKYLETRWKESVSSNVDIGIEILKVQNNLE